MRKAIASLRQQQRLILLTFEVFWIVVFLLDRASRGGEVGVPQFLYVNF